MNESFISQIARVLSVGGQLHFWTDVEEYFRVTIDLISTCPSLQGPIIDEPSEPNDVQNLEPDYRTHYDRRCQLESQPVYRATFQRK